jgi:PTH1 family peptidyl-tRNA hydrolase
MIELTVFLGNPGEAYAHNRHNTGWLLAERLPFYGLLNWEKKFKGRYASLARSRLAAFQEPAVFQEPATDFPSRAPQGAGAEKLHFLMPQTFMNLSGDSVHAAASFFKIPLDRILLVQDELELPLGTVSVKFSGGLGGHNGLRSMKARFGSPDFWRLRVGIGRPGDREPGKGGPPGVHADIAGWVLADFAAFEEPLLNQALAAASDALVRTLLRGPESMLPEWGKKKVVE